MKHIVLIVLVTGSMSVVALSCRSSKKAQSESLEIISAAVQTVVPDTFVLPYVPETMRNPDARARYLVMHYWDRYDFTDRNLILRPEIAEQAFADYINIFNYVQKEDIEATLAYMLNRAETDTVVYAHFVSLYEKYLYDPNSPFRNEDNYLSVLNEVVRSPLLTEEEKSRYAFQLEMAMRNRIGQSATDFTYTTASGQSFRLFDLKSEYTLLIFTDPGCFSCVSATEYLRNSGPLNNALALNSPTRTMLTVLALYLETDLEAWRAHLPEMPSLWLNAYDKGEEINKKKLYDTKAIPSLYLLDKDKKVILKDAPVEVVESFFSVQ